MRRLSPLCALGLAAVMLGCGSTSSYGGSSSATTAKSAAAPPAAAKGNLNVTETDFKLTPAAVQTTGGNVTVSIKNAGATVHALEIENASAGGTDLKSSVIQPGGAATITASLKAGKSYVAYCPIANHKALGMKATITVGA